MPLGKPGSVTGLRPSPNPNLLINGDMRVAQRGTTITAATAFPNSDASFTLDRWLLVGEAATDIADVSRSTTAPTGAANSMQLLVVDDTAGATKFGVIQILEGFDTRALAGGEVSVSFQAQMGTGDATDQLRFALLAWDGTSDQPTLDVVDAWGDEGTNPTLVANWNFDYTPTADLTLTASWQEFHFPGISVRSDAENLAVFIWSEEDTATAGDIIRLANVKLEAGPVVTDYHPRAIGEEVRLCQRYFWKTFDLDVIPGDNVSDLGALNFESQLNGGRNTDIRFHTKMHKAPSLTAFNPGSGTAASWVQVGTSTTQTFSTDDIGQSGARVAMANSASGAEYYVHITADAEVSA